MEPITRGETKSYTLTAKNPDGSIINLTGKKVRSTLRLRDVIQIDKQNSAITGGSDAEIQLLAQSGATLGQLLLKFVQADTLNLGPCLLEGDLWVDEQCVLKFQLPVTQAQTRAFPA